MNKYETTLLEVCVSLALMRFLGRLIQLYFKISY